MNTVRLSAIQAELGPIVVSDAELALLYGLPEREVARYSRGRTRLESPDGEGPTALAARAAARLLAARDLTATDIDFLIFATNTPDMFFPGSGVLLQNALGCRTVGGLDVRGQCTGFLVALDVARRFVATGSYGRVLVAAADTPSHFNARDGRSPRLACAMGDSAVAALLEPGAEQGNILAISVHTDGSRAADYWCEYPASRHFEGPELSLRNRLPVAAVAAGKHFPTADFAALRDLALERVPSVLDEALAKADCRRADVAVIAHVDPDVERELGAAIATRVGRVVTSDLLYSGGASVGVLLARSVASGAVQPGQTVALLTSGAGASWGAAIVRQQ
ncbi:MAG: 3-oxoacyl-ACP synthase III family protein [Deltaproteobacteria bacterium]|nr:3-oxoacyl-ACP synthase III family protein [Deltaproteobacteria bacterium]